ncbi:PH domain-containing protein [Candidatus Saccharibacteria bacterium]|nr:PH domain-containing protein [Candidatus Saccharibacteria bacterium]
MTPTKPNEPIPDAYDADGRPLYYHPPTPVTKKAPSKQSQEQKALVKLRHDRSRHDYPGLELASDEYVEISVIRHKIGIIAIWVGEALAIILILIAYAFFLVNDPIDTIAYHDTARIYITVVAIALIALCLVFGWVGVTIFKYNKLIVTNKRVIQRIMTSLFDRKTQTIDLGSIEDVSYRQSDIFQVLINFGTIRLATVGKDTTYQFNFVSNPSEQVKNIIKLVNENKSRSKSK